MPKKRSFSSHGRGSRLGSSRSNSSEKLTHRKKRQGQQQKLMRLTRRHKKLTRSGRKHALEDLNSMYAKRLAHTFSRADHLKQVAKRGLVTRRGAAPWVQIGVKVGHSKADWEGVKGTSQMRINIKPRKKKQ